MRAGRLQLLSVVPALLALGGCMDGSGTTGGAGGGGSPPATGGGGTGGAVTTTTTTTTTGPLTCSVNVSNPPLTGDCDLLQQDCPPGKTCVPSNSKTVCQQSGGGLKGPGKVCNLNNGTNECQAGLFCIGANEIGICTRPCCKDDNQPCGGGDCNGEVNFGTTVVNMCSYSEQCTLFQEGTCDPGLKCQLVYSDTGLSVCTLPAPMNVPEGEACQYVNQCGENQVCFSGMCRYNCLLSNSSGEPGMGGCPAGQKCIDGYPKVESDIGVCQP